MKRYKKRTTETRIKSFYLLFVFITSLLALRLYYIQVFTGEDLKVQALKQRSVEISLSGKRGTIYDRNLVPLTNNKVTKTLIANRELIKEDKELVEELKQKSSLSVLSISNLLNSKDRIIQIPLEEDIVLKDTNNMMIVDITDRYTEDKILSHVIGYINKSDNIGLYGIEKVYDEFLKTTDKESVYIEFDENKSVVLGSSQYVDNVLDPQDPAGVKLTIDYNIQKIVEDILTVRNVKGSVVVADVETGEILAMSSRPNFNQNNMELYFNREDLALYNKAIQVSYPPGSIFKIVVLMAGLNENMDLLNHTFYCQGHEKINNTTIKCSGTHGEISLLNGFAKSCNSVFIQIGKEVGAKKIIEMAKNLGFGEKINIGLSEEIAGILPEGQDLLGPAIGNISIGQGKIQATPLQITNMMIAIANNGIQKSMSIVQGITSKDGQIIKPYNKEEDKEVLSENLALVAKLMLEEVVTSGTARAMDINSIGGAAGKTGSAEGLINGNYTIHGWFAGYYPKYNPKYAITVLVEDAKSGSSSAAPVFSEICNAIYDME